MRVPWIVTIVLLHTSLLHTARAETTKALLARITSPSIYDKTLRPGRGLEEEFAEANGTQCDDVPADVVRMQFETKNIAAIDQKSQSYALEGYLRLWWTDRRLSFADSPSVCGKNITLRSTDAIWTPDLYFENSVSVKLGDGRDGELVTIDSNGAVFWSRQARLSLRCNMGFGQLPFDKQHCLFLAGMYTDLAEDVLLMWHPDRSPLGNYPHTLSSNDWAIDGVTNTSLLDEYPSGSYSYAKACITYARLSARGVREIFTAMIFVGLSYCGFWISPAAAPGRIALAIITVLIIVNFINSIEAGLPRIAYSVWLTTFLLVSMLFNVC